MIFVTVGTQLPFDRLIRLVDAIAPDLPGRVFAQTGNGKFQPANMDWRSTLSPQDFKRIMRSARIVVGHAGIGTVLNARLLRKPMILFPRRAMLGEHRNDHQLATTRTLAGRPGIAIALNDADLRSLLLDPHKIGLPHHSNASSGEELKAALSEYLAKFPRRARNPLLESRAQTEMTS